MGKIKKMRLAMRIAKNYWQRKYISSFSIPAQFLHLLDFKHLLK